MSETEYKIDESLIIRISEDNRAAKLILIAYLDELTKNPNNKTNLHFHRHYAARLIRAIEDRPNIEKNVN